MTDSQTDIRTDDEQNEIISNAHLSFNFSSGGLIRIRHSPISSPILRG